MQLKFFLAQNALTHFYCHQCLTSEEFSYFQYLETVSKRDDFLKLKLRLICEENNDVIISAVVADSNPEEQIFLYDKFCRDDSFVKIGIKLHIHPNDIQRWRDKFLADISSLMEYNLPVSDIFSLNKVEALIFSLERMISFMLTYGKYDPSVLNLLKKKLSAYQQLHFIIKQCIESNSDNIEIKIIRTKILNPNITAEELARCFHSSHTTVNKYLHYFQ